MIGALAVHSPEFDAEVSQFLEAVYVEYQYDFRAYAMASLRRRISAAMSRFDCRTPAELKEKTLADPRMFAQLLGYLTVQVSEMFRDPAYFRALRAHVVPVLRTYPSLKIWVAGCSTGEEAYSLAILLREEGLLERSLIYATDIHPWALEQADAGVFTADRVEAFTENHRRSGASTSLSDYYTAAYGRVVFDKSLKRQIVFCDHSLATDSVFAEVQFVSCRNVLIYFNRVLQDRAIGLFEDALCRKGFLGLGAKESIQFSIHAQAFTTVTRDEKIFQKREGT